MPLPRWFLVVALSTGLFVIAGCSHTASGESKGATLNNPQVQQQRMSAQQAAEAAQRRLEDQNARVGESR